MAIGDDALADGMQLVPGTMPANQLDTEINRTRDYIVQRIASKIAALWPLPITRGGTGKATAAEAVAALGAVKDGIGTGLEFISPGFGRISFKAPGVSNGTELARMADIPSPTDVSGIYNGFLSSAIYNRTLAGWRTAAVQSDGTLGQTSSAARFKKNVEPLEITDEEIQRLVLVEFDWIRDGSHDVGLIADSVAEILPWAVFYDDEGLILGIHYERLALAMLPALQRLITGLDLIAQRVTALEEK